MANVVSVWQVAHKKRKGESFVCHYKRISGAEFKIHVNIIRSGLHFLTAPTSGSSHEAKHERSTKINASISSVVDRRRWQELFADARWMTAGATGGAPSKSHLRAWLPVATRCFLPSLTICPRTTCRRLPSGGIAHECHEENVASM